MTMTLSAATNTPPSAEALTVIAGLDHADKCERNFEFIHTLFKRAQKHGELDRRFDCEEMAFGFYGMANFYLVGHLVCPDCHPDQQTARRIVELFLIGAGAKPGKTK